ncbi:ankyrin [Daldinia loculata]|nr:ankyrin [Daldinia loculata]
MEENAIPTFSTNPGAWLLNIPEELAIYLLQFTDDHDKFALSRAGSNKLYRIATYELLRTSSRTRNSALSWACCNGDKTLLRTVVKLGADVNHVFTDPNPCGTRQSPSPQTPLNLAIGHQQVNIVELLLEEYHADANVSDSYMGPSPLEWALAPIISIQQNMLYFTELLLDHGAQYYLNPYPAFIDRSAEVRIFYNDHIPSKVLERVIASWTRADIRRYYMAQYLTCLRYLEQPEIESFTSIQLEKLRILRDADATRGGRFERLLAIELLDYPAINEPDPFCEATIWTFAVNQLYYRIPGCSNKKREDMLSLLQVILDAGADPRRSSEAERQFEYTDSYYNRFFGNGWLSLKTPLSCICASWDHSVPEIDKVIDFLVQAGEPVDAQDRGGLQALHFASKYLHPHLVKQLIGYGADANAVDVYGFTALHIITSRFDKPLYPGNLRYCSYETETMWRQRRALTVSTLLDHGADPSIVDNKGFTPLHYSCRYGLAEIVSLLITDPRVDINAETHELGTPLHYLPRLCEPWEFGRITKYDTNSTDQQIEHRVKIAEILINAGADVRARDGDNWMPIVYARRYGFVELVNVLLAHGGDDGFGLGEDEYGDSTI